MPCESRQNQERVFWAEQYSRKHGGQFQYAPSMVFIINDSGASWGKCAAMAARTEHNNRQELS